MDYPNDLTSNRCAAFGQCKQQETQCEPSFAPANTTCGSQKVCDGLGACVAACPTTTGAQRVCSAACPCGAGEGVCSSDNECEAGFVCATDSAKKFGFSGNTCLPSHCDNDIQDSAELSVDCGGECGCKARVIAIPVPAGAVGVQGNDVSANGKVVVGLVNFGSDPRGKGFVWTVGDATVTILQQSTSSAYCQASAISGSGTLIGGSCAGKAVTWSSASSTPTKLGELDSNWISTVFGISESGAVLVGAYGTQSLAQPVWWKPGDGILAHDLSASVQKPLNAVSADGLMAITGSAPGQLLLLSNGTDTPVAPPTSGTAGDLELAALSADGSVVVGRYPANDGKVHAFRWAKNVGAQDLGFPQGATYAMASDLDRNGNRVVGSWTLDSANQAFFWDASGARSLSAELLQRGLELPADVTFSDARALSLDGTTIVTSSQVVTLNP